MSGPTHALARLIADDRLDDLSDETLAAVKRCLLDTIGCIIGGARVEPGRIVLQSAIDASGAPEATLFGQGMRVPVASAARAQGYLANALDFDDTSGVTGHPGAPIVPAVLAVAEKYEASGRDVIAGMVAGYDVTARVTLAIEPSLERRAQVKSMATHQTLGVAAAVSRTRGFSAEQTRHVLGAAGASSPVPFVRKWGYRERPISWVKNNYGAAAGVAVEAAELVGRGFRASETILDGPTGFWVMAGSDRWYEDRLLAGMPARAIDSTSFKPYPCCRFLHPSMDAARAVALDRPECREPDQVVQVVVEVFSEYVVTNFMEETPAHEIDAQFSLPHSIAVSLMRDPCDPASYQTATITDPSIASMRQKIRAIPGEGVGASDTGDLWSRVTVHLVSGESVSEGVDCAWGEPGNPMTWDQLSDKFVRLTHPSLGLHRAAAVIFQIERLESLDSIRELTDLLTGNDELAGARRAQPAARD